MRVSAYESFAQLPAQEWDSLTVGQTIYSSSGFAGIREEELPEGAAARHLLARESEGSEALAGLEAYTFNSPPHGLYTPADLLEGLIPEERHRHLAASPLAIGAGWSEFRGQLPGREGTTPAQRKEAVAALTAEAHRFATDAGTSVLAYYFLPRAQAEEVAAAHGDDAVTVFHDVETSLPIGLWDDFDDYAAWLPAKRRPRARRELRQFRNGGRIVRDHKLPDVVKEMAPMNSALMQKHGHTAFDVERVATVYDRQGRYLGDHSSLLMAEEPDGTQVGFALRYRQGDMLYGRVAGFDYSRPNLHDYFNLVFYHPIAEGVGRTTEAIHLGLGTFEAKMNRGAQPTPLYTVLVGVDRPLDADAAAVAQHNRAAVNEFADTHSGFVVGGIDADSWQLD
jgi:uncharacterized protein